MKSFLKRLILPFLIIVAIVTMSAIAYNNILKVEEETCWKTLENTASSINKEIESRFKDNISILKLASVAMVQENRVNSYQAISQHLNSFQPMTIFNRIDIVYPDNQILYQNGEMTELKASTSFEELSRKDEHMSLRTTDALTGKEIIYYAVPIRNKNKIVAIMVGVINCENMPSIFQVSAYDGEAICTLVDYRDGSFILDEWHKKLGNIFEMKQRTPLKGYEDVDLVNDVRNGKGGVTKYISAENGENSFMYYTPSKTFQWELMIVAQEKVVNKSVYELKGVLKMLGIFEGVLILMYFVWTLFTVKQLEKSKDEIEEKKNKFESLSYTDTLTNLFNRNKYNEVIDDYQMNHHENVGVALLDLNGLKQINDKQGHKRGDALIQNTAACLSKVFPNQSYRIGGDEFVVLAFGLDKEKFEENIKKLERMMGESKINISIGTVWEEYMSDFNMQLQKADEQMYAQKKEYYNNSIEHRDRRKGRSNN